MWVRRIFTEQNLSAWQQEILNGIGLSSREYLLLLVSAILLFAVGLIHERNPQTSIRTMLDQKPFAVRWLAIFLAAAVILTFGAYGPGYTAAEFAYMQF